MERRAEDRVSMSEPRPEAESSGDHLLYALLMDDGREDQRQGPCLEPLSLSPQHGLFFKNLFNFNALV